MSIRISSFASVKNERMEEDEDEDDIAWIPNPKEMLPPPPRVKTEVVKSEPGHLDDIRPNNGGDDELGSYMDDVPAREMAEWGLPTSFAMNKNSPAGGIQESTTRKGEKKTFYCELCLVELNSEDTMVSHKNGMKHLKKEAAERQRRIKAENEAGMSEPERAIKLIDNPRPVPKKVPICLSEKLRESSDPIVGLKYISETIPCSSNEMEPYYECYLCGTQGEANGMFNHLMGRGHREKVLQNAFPNDQTYFDMPRDMLMREVRRLSQMDGVDQMNTAHSDELYPWPAGKAPWSVEKGGSGFVPTAISNRKETRRRMVLQGLDPFDPKNLGVPNLANPTSLNLPAGPIDVRDMSPKDIKNISTTKDLYHAYATADMLLSRITEFHTKNCNPNDVNALQTMQDTAKTSLIAAENMGTMSVSRDSTMSSRRMSPSMSPHSNFSSPRSYHSGPSYNGSRRLTRSRSRSPSPSTSRGRPRRF